MIVASADAVIALAGEGGTLAEIGFAKKFGKPIVALESWPEIDGLQPRRDSRRSGRAGAQAGRSNRDGEINGRSGSKQLRSDCSNERRSPRCSA